jgi:hypothetical protein
MNGIIYNLFTTLYGTFYNEQLTSFLRAKETLNSNGILYI